MGPADQVGARTVFRPAGRQRVALAGPEDVERLQFPRSRLVTTARRSKCATRTSRSPTCSTWRSRRGGIVQGGAVDPQQVETLKRVGLSYVKGQQATTLSGGEAQRVKLAKELSRRSTGRTLYILDEPTTGLHFHDVAQLLDVLHELVDQGNTMIVIEHNLEVVKTADWIVDMGPEGGDAGGEVVAEGTPEQIARNPNSYTGRYLKPVLGRKAKGGRRAAE
jgi:ABC-type glutathione transport system ATPase component